MTSAQRARLVVAMGLLNLILATVALTAGFVAPPRPTDEIALRSPVPTIAPGSSASVAPAATQSPISTQRPGASGEPSPSPVTPPVEPSAPPSATSTPDGGPVVAVVPTPTPEPTAAVPTATAVPPALPTARPTARPSATPKPVVGTVHKARPPCPDRTSGPPGHRKVTPPPARPCGSGHGHGSSGTGVVVLLPLAIGGVAAAIRRRLIGGSGRPVRRLRSKAIGRKDQTPGDS